MKDENVIHANMAWRLGRALYRYEGAEFPALPRVGEIVRIVIPDDEWQQDETLIVHVAQVAHRVAPFSKDLPRADVFPEIRLEPFEMPPETIAKLRDLGWIPE